LEEELANIVSALTWLRDHDEGVLGLRLVGSFRPFWGILGTPVDLPAWLESFMPSLEKAPLPVRARTLLAMAWLECCVNFKPGFGYERDPAWRQTSYRLAKEAVALYRQAGDEWLLLRGLIGAASLIVYHLCQPDAREAGEQFFRESLPLARRLGSSGAESASLRGLGTIAQWWRDDLEEAETLFREALAVDTRAGLLLGMADSLVALAGLATIRGEPAQALELLATAIDKRREAGGDVRRLRFGYGCSALELGDHAAIETTFREVHAISRLPDYRDDYLSWLELLAASAAARGDPARAVPLFGAVRALSGIEFLFHGQYHRFSDLSKSYRAAARQQLGEERWKAAWEEGRAMTLEQAIAYALGETQ
jgi:tetratricopeptide (TPR) repeat protein